MDKLRGTAAPVDLTAVRLNPGARLKVGEHGELRILLPKQTSDSRFNLRAALQRESPADRQARASEHSLSKMNNRYTAQKNSAGTQFELRGTQSESDRATHRKANAQVAEVFMRQMRAVVPSERAAALETRIRDREASLPPKLFANHLALIERDMKRDARAGQDERASVRADMLLRLAADGQDQREGVKELLDRAVEYCITDRIITMQSGGRPDEAGIARALGLAKAAAHLNGREKARRDGRLDKLDHQVRASGHLDRTTALDIARLRLQASDMKASDFDAKARQLDAELRSAAPRLSDAAGHAKLAAAWAQCAAFFGAGLAAGGAETAAIDASVQTFRETVDPSISAPLIRQAVVAQSQSKAGPGVDMTRALVHLKHAMQLAGKQVHQASETEVLRAIMQAAAQLPVELPSSRAIRANPCCTLRTVGADVALDLPKQAPEAKSSSPGAGAVPGEDVNAAKLRQMQRGGGLGLIARTANEVANRPVVDALSGWLEGHAELASPARVTARDKLLAESGKQPEVFAVYVATLADAITTAQRAHLSTLREVASNLEAALDRGQVGAAPADPKWRQQVLGLAQNLWIEREDERFLATRGAPVVRASGMVSVQVPAERGIDESLGQALKAYRSWHPDRFPDATQAVDIDAERRVDGEVDAPAPAAE